jgi:hypothetical protein
MLVCGSTEPGMNAWTKTLLIGDPSQQPGELYAFFVVESSA